MFVMTCSCCQRGVCSHRETYSLGQCITMVLVSVHLFLLDGLSTGVHPIFSPVKNGSVDVILMFPVKCRIQKGAHSPSFFFILPSLHWYSHHRNIIWQPIWHVTKVMARMKTTRVVGTIQPRSIKHIQCFTMV